ncbi:hypothetical protein F5Y00DRAFT_262777 [Daldinia vernicosa]|uniref:uncharacterized protein n=1 Tax=Daldinia vernicosa TaxID=114800 RepID=UPI0020079F65|nr:uncharacterized protein F5Y00DRAFT_262777 [Daldinia vernicosa]KAI0848145.1 hypothetical protein F5Y00DRAFT_262777 [Daldinia vernicosa]
MSSDDTTRNNRYQSLPTLSFDDSPRSSLQHGPWVADPTPIHLNHAVAESGPEPERVALTAPSLDIPYIPNAYPPDVTTATTSNASSNLSTDTNGSISTSLSKVDKRKRFRLRDWLWEFGAAVLSIGCTTAVVAVLYAFQGKELSSWNFIFRISLNSFVSILSGLSRASLLVSVASCISQLKWIYFTKSAASLYRMEIFDLASRGPWGALVLLWHMNIKAKLAAAASLITILSFGIDPFSQQMLSYPSRSIRIPDVASFGRAEMYSSGAWTGVTGTWIPERNMDLKMQGAILNGLYTINAPLHFRCPTGTCVWPEFTTLAVTSHCKNATSGTKITCKDGLPSAGRSCDYMTPNGFIIQTSSHESSGGGYQPSFNSTARETSSVDECYSDGLHGSTIVTFATANLLERTMDNPEITECYIEWSARIYRNLSVENGTMSLGVLDELALDYVESIAGNQNVGCLLKFSIASDAGNPQRNNIFTINPTDYNRIGAYLAGIFSSYDEQDFGRALMNSPSIEETVRNITESMTYAIGDSHNATQIAGDAITFEQFISVSWPWVILPLVEVLMGLILLVLTLHITKRGDMASWKSSSLVPFLIQNKGWEHEDLSDLSIKGIESISQRMRGSLQYNMGAAMFIRVDER